MLYGCAEHFWTCRTCGKLGSCSRPPACANKDFVRKREREEIKREGIDKDTEGRDKRARKRGKLDGVISTE